MTEKQTPKKLDWQAPDFEYYPKNISWFWRSIVIAVALLAFALWQKNFLFAVFVVIAEIMMVVWAYKLPSSLKFVLNEKGVLVGESFYHYSELEHFSILGGNGELTEIVLKNKRRFSPYVTIRIEKRLLPKAKEILAMYLPEQEYEEPLPDLLSRFIKF